MTYMSHGSTGVAWREEPESLQHSRLEIAVAPSAVGAARHWTADRLAKADPPYSQDLIDAAALLVSELVTNAIQAVDKAAAWAGALANGQPRVCLVIAGCRNTVRIEVHDSVCMPIPPTRRRDDDDETGRGLIVVTSLAEKWGWQPTASGKVVWCELDECRLNGS